MPEEPRALRGAAIVTGGASGLGAACAERLHAEGMGVLVADRDAERGEALAERLGERAAFAATDVTDAAAVEAAVAAAAGLAPEGLRLSVACAGIAPAERVVSRRGPHSPETFAQVIAVNLLGTFHLLRAAAAAMASNEPLGDERGLHVSTALGRRLRGPDRPGRLLGVQGRRRRPDAARRARPRPARRPGVRDRARAVRHAAMQTLPDAAREALGNAAPFPQRLGRPDEFAELVVAIARNPMLNGETIRLDGALRLAPR